MAGAAADNSVMSWFQNLFAPKTASAATPQSPWSNPATRPPGPMVAQANPLQTAGSPTSQVAGGVPQASVGLLAPTGMPPLDYTQLGKTSENKSESNRSSGASESTSKALPGSEYGTAYSRLADGTPGLTGERAALGGMAKIMAPYMANEAQRTPFMAADLGPLGNMLSHVSRDGQDVAKGYVAPVNSALAPLMQAGAALAKGNEGLATGEQAFLGQQLQDKTAATQAASQGGSAGAGFSGQPIFAAIQDASAEAHKEVDQQAQDGTQAIHNNLSTVQDLFKKYNGSLPGYRQLGGPKGIWVQAGDPRLQGLNPMGQDEVDDVAKYRGATQGLSSALSHSLFGARLTEVENGATAKMLQNLGGYSPSQVAQGMLRLQKNSGDLLSQRQGTLMAPVRSNLQQAGALSGKDFQYDFAAPKKDPKILQFAKDFPAETGGDYARAKSILLGRKYKPNE